MSSLIERVQGNVLEPFERLLILLTRALPLLPKDSCNLQMLPHGGLDFNVNYSVCRPTLPGSLCMCEVLCWGYGFMETGLELPSGIPAPLQGAKSRSGAAKGKAWALRLCFQIKWQGTTMGVFPQKLDPTLENKWGEGKQFRLSGEGQRNRHKPRSSALGRGNAILDSHPHHLPCVCPWRISFPSTWEPIMSEVNLCLGRETSQKKTSIDRGK